MRVRRTSRRFVIRNDTTALSRARTIPATKKRAGASRHSLAVYCLRPNRFADGSFRLFFSASHSVGMRPFKVLQSRLRAPHGSRPFFTYIFFSCQKCRALLGLATIFRYYAKIGRTFVTVSMPARARRVSSGTTPSMSMML